MALLDNLPSDVQAPPTAAPSPAPPRRSILGDLPDDVPAAPTDQSPVGAAPQTAAPTASGLPRISRDMSEDQLITAFGYDPKVIKQSPYYSSGSLKAMIGRYGSRAGKNVMPGADFSNRIYENVRGMRNFALHVTKPDSPDSAFFDLQTKIARADYEQNVAQLDEEGAAPYSPQQFAADIVTPTPLGPLTAATGVYRSVKGAQAAKALATGAKPVSEAGAKALNIGANLGEAAITGASAARFDTMGSEEALDAASGDALAAAGISGGIQAVLPPVLRGVTRGVNVARGVAQPGVETAAIRQFEKHEIPYRVGDVAPTGLGRGIESYSAGIPGSGGMAAVEAGQKAAGRAADDMADKHFNDMMEVVDRLKNDPNDLKALRRAANSRTAAPETRDAARAVLARLDEAQKEGDWAEIVASSGQLHVFKQKLAGDRLYEKARRLGSAIPDVPLTGAHTLLDQAIANEARAGKVDTRYLEKLKQMRLSTTPTAGGHVATDFNARVAFKKLLGQQITDAANGQGGYPPGSEKVLMRIQDALMNDLKTAATKTGKLDAFKALTKADEFHSNTVLPARDSALAKVIDTKDPDRVVAAMLKTGVDRTHGADRFYKGLDERGRAAVRYYIAKNAYAAATATGDFNPKAYAKYVKDYEESHKIFLAGNDKFEMVGFANAMRTLDRMGPDNAHNIDMTIRRALPSVATAAAGLGAAAGQPIVAGGLSVIFGTGLAAHWARNTAPMRKFWLAASDLKPGSPQMERLVKEFTEQHLSKAAQRGATSGDE